MTSGYRNCGEVAILMGSWLSAMYLLDDNHTPAFIHFHPYASMWPVIVPKFGYLLGIELSYESNQ